MRAVAPLDDGEVTDGFRQLRRAEYVPLPARVGVAAFNLLGTARFRGVDGVIAPIHQHKSRRIRKFLHRQTRR